MPRSKTAATATVSFTITTTETGQLILKSGLVCVGAVDNTSYTYSIPEDVSVNISNGTASFSGVKVYQGVFLTKDFTIDTSYNQRFILDNSDIDTSTIVVKVGNREYKQIDNIITIDKNSMKQ